MFVTYASEELRVDGTRQTTMRTAKRGEIATFSVGEAARLDALGALAPPGATAADIERDLESTREAYYSARRTVPEGA